MEQITFEQKKEERLVEWKGWITDFFNLNEENPEREYEPIPFAAELLNEYYWRLTRDFLKPLLVYSEGESEHNLHYYKIISASELTVMAVLPFNFKEVNTKEARRRINAEFAFFVAVSIMLNWKINGKEIIELEHLEKVVTYNEVIDIDETNQAKRYAVNFRDEHIDWLQDLNTAAPLPVLSNSQTWRLCYLASKAVANTGDLL